MNPRGQNAVARALSWAHEHRPRFVRELQQFVQFQSVSAQKMHHHDLTRCAEWLAAHLRHIGMPVVTLIRNHGAPIVFARDARAAGAPTVLVYGHYDVQPADPDREWKIPPFSGAVQAGRILGRGASDDKGQCFAHIKALESFLRTGGNPVNVICLFEGEEEIGSGALRRWLAQQPISADVAIVSDMPMADEVTPAITIGARGALSFDLELDGAKQDLHSGLFGGAIRNPAEGLCALIAGLHDDAGRIRVPGFYERVSENRLARERLARDAPSDADVAAAAGVDRLWGEPGYTAHERTTIRPSITVTGMTAGYTGEGPKAIIPSRALAKISVRLSPGQDPDSAAALLAADLRRRCPRELRLALHWHFGAHPAELPLHHSVVRLGQQACRLAFGRPARLRRMGGTIPIVDVLQREHGIPVLMVGFGGPADHVHAPNESFSLDTFIRAVAAGVHLLAGASRANQKLRAVPAVVGAMQ